MFALAAPGDNNRLGGQQAVTFFRRSNLSIDKLKEIWKVAANTSNDFLTKDEFYIALRLIAYAQNNMQYDEKAILFDLEVGLPKFDDEQLALTSSQHQKLDIKPALPIGLPSSFDDLDFSSANVREQLSQSAFRQPQMQQP